MSSKALSELSDEEFLHLYSRQQPKEKDSSSLSDEEFIAQFSIPEEDLHHPAEHRPQLNVIEKTVRPFARMGRALGGGFAGTVGNLRETLPALFSIASGREGPDRSEINRLQGFIPSHQSDDPFDTEDIPEMGDIGNLFPTTQDVYGVVDYLTGDKLKPQDGFERGLDTILEFIGSRGAMAPRSLRSLNAVLGDVGAGTGFAVAQENEAGPGAALGLTLAGGLAGGKVGNALTKTPPSKGEILKKVFRVAPEQLKEEVIAAAKQEGIDLPLSASTTNKGVRFTESRLSSTPFSAERYETFMKTVGEQFIHSYEDMLDKIAAKKFTRGVPGGGLNEAGSELQSAVRKSNEASQTAAGNLYEEALKVGKEESAQVPRTTKALNDVIDSLEKTAGASPTEKSVLNYLKELKSNIAEKNAGSPKASKILDQFGNPMRAAPQRRLPKLGIEDLLGTKRSLNDVIDFEQLGTSKQLIKRVLGAVKQDIQQYGKLEANGEFYEKYLQAEKNFARHSQTYRNDVAKSLLRNQVPENTLRVMNTPSGVEKVGRAIAVNKEGASLFQALKRFKLEELIGSSVVSDATNESRFQAASSILSDKKKAELIRSLAGEQNFRKLENLQKVASAISEGANQFRNTSKSADVYYSLAALGQILGGLATFNPAFIATGVGQVGAPILAARFMTDTKIINEALAAARYAKSGNKESYLKSMQNISRWMAQTIEKLPQDQQLEDRED